MAFDMEILRWPAYRILAGLRRGDFSPVDLISATLKHIERVNPKINAVCTVSATALEEARELERRYGGSGDLPPLYGLPVGIKDVTPVAGMRTTYGSPLYADYVPEEDALVVRRFREAGAIIIGKTNTPEFATGGNTFNDVFGLTRNPWNPALSAGGSTGGGAAALAAGMIALAEGTDLGGSLRIPASFCGIVGLRPSPGLIPTYPSEYLWDEMQVTGVMGRTADDIALALGAVSGPDPISPVCQPDANRRFPEVLEDPLPGGLKIAYCPDIAGIGIEGEIDAICRQAARDLQRAGASVDEIEYDLSFAWEPFLAIRGFWMVAQQYRRLDKVEQFGPNLKGNVEAGLKVSMKELGAAEHARREIWERFYHFFREYDYLLTPCMAVPPFPVEQNYPESIAGKQMRTYVDWIAPTFILSMTGLPVGCVPAGLTEARLPVGLQIVGPPRGEEQVLMMARQIQQQQPIGLPELHD